MKIAVVGSGYVGLVAGICFAKFGHSVICLDKDISKIEKLKSGIIPIHEPGLQDLLHEVVKLGKISFSNNLKKINDADVVIIAVGTPSTKNGSANLKYLNDVVKIIAKNCPQGKAVVIKSTVPVGTATEIKNKFQAINPNIQYDIISNPEFLREGYAVGDFLNPDRVVIGYSSANAKSVAQTLYAPLVEKGVHIHYVNNTTAELIKYSANCYLAMRIAFINEMADIAEVAGANIDEVATGIGLDKRIGLHYLKAGPGYGGSCFPKDTMALAKYAKYNKVNSRIVDAVITSNIKRKERISERVVNELKTVKGVKAAILGLVFKADTDDLRDSPSIEIVKNLISNGYKVSAYDPSECYEEFDKIVSGVSFSKTLIEAVKGADIAVVVTEWEEFLRIDLSAMRAEMKGNTIFDLRNVILAEDATKEGFRYLSIGRPNA